jgi:N-acetylmuramoyl-L-alanine amidase
VVLMEKDYQKKYDGFDPNSPEANIIFSLYQDSYVDQSLRMASFVQDEMRRNGRESRGVKQAGFLVLYRTYMPGVLIETGFLSNKKEEKFLVSADGQAEIANSIFHAFRNYKNAVEQGEAEKAPDTIVQSKKTEPVQSDSILVKDSSSLNTKVDTASLYKPKAEKARVDSAEKKADAIKPTYYFSVQVLLSSKPLPPDSEKFKGIKNTNEEFDNGAYKYTVGEFHTFNEAIAEQNKMRLHGFKDCFIVGYKNGKRVPVNEIRKATQD